MFNGRKFMLTAFIFGECFIMT